MAKGDYGRALDAYEAAKKKVEADNKALHYALGQMHSLDVTLHSHPDFAAHQKAEIEKQMRAMKARIDKLRRRMEKDLAAEHKAMAAVKKLGGYIPQ